MSSLIKSSLKRAIVGIFCLKILVPHNLFMYNHLYREVEVANYVYASPSICRLEYKTVNDTLVKLGKVK